MFSYRKPVLEAKNYCPNKLGQLRVLLRNVHSVDAKWLKRWSLNPPKLLQRDSPPKTHYQLAMFPYPSGKLHIGHLRVYTISDTLARFRRMRGFKVIHPIGWDAFGLPAENAAIEHGLDAADWTYNHIDIMRTQLKRMMVSFDWEREIITCRPDYYKHTQQIFIELFKANLAYRKNALVNWDPIDKTVLANEQIDSQGKSWRSGAIVEQRKLEQWYLKITNYAEDLLKDLDLLKNWPAAVKQMQSKWIGLSEGSNVHFSDKLCAFTTRIETLPGVKFIAVAQDHKLAQEHSSTTRPSGLIEDLEAINPLTNEPLPVYVAEYVVSEYAQGVVMGVPAHDERDAAFWNKVGNLADPIVPIVNLSGEIVSGPFVGSSLEEAKKRTIEACKEKIEPKQHMRLRDWLVSRQRFWGAPIPMIHCDSCGIIPVPDSDLPVRLPTDRKNVPLSQNKEWLQTTCPSCKGPAKRDSDTMDTFMDSSWYFFRYLDPKNKSLPFKDSAINETLPVDSYIGGIEHAILHLLYSRFIAKVLFKRGKWDGGNMNGEPFKQLVTLGMVHGKAYRDKVTEKYLKPEEVAKVSDKTQLLETLEKMSKSKYNGVDPLEVIEAHGADAVRAHMLFQAPVSDTLIWDAQKIVGIERWLGKLRALGKSIGVQISTSRKDEHEPLANDTKTWNQACDIVKSITNSMETDLSLNTVVSDYMKLTKLSTTLLDSNVNLAAQAYEVLLKVVAPVCPAQAEDMWEDFLLSQNLEYRSIHSEVWPTMERIKTLRNEKVEWKVLINSKPCQVVASPSATSQELVELLGLSKEKTCRVIHKPKIKLLSILTGS